MKILLACSAGMSTSLLVSKMEKVAEEKGLEAEIWAVAQDKVISELPKADVLLIGPQMRFLKKKFEAKAQELNVPVDIIDPVAYGRVNGEAVLDKAMELIEAK
ncbi:PTS system, cellobiose-specific IIB component [Evansella caseinilytica]|uniref:PTS system, cellobiose-specific IIB component n=1 Tax=Evansella caseinilytica TaxID=1503961 RepID=A0A1H3UU88_9BACI|nr:PTS sugar transporter subunit IIB [Evansella caseinilytica]SDZ65816.1 PTS system, cellobiose-specific IIB component [Evansella caseinilytica]